MREVTGIARNLAFLQDEPDGPLTASVEVIIIASEPIWRIDGGGDMSKQREAVNLRFATGPDGLRTLAKRLTEYADDAECRAAALNAEREPIEDWSLTLAPPAPTPDDAEGA